MAPGASRGPLRTFIFLQESAAPGLPGAGRVEHLAENCMRSAASRALVANNESPECSSMPHVRLIFAYQADKIGPKSAQDGLKAAENCRKAAQDDAEVANDAPNATSKPPKTPKRPLEPRSCSHSGLPLPTQTHEICGFTYGKRMIPKSRLFRLRGPQMKPRASKKLLKSLPKEAKRDPQDAQMTPRAAQREPEGCP